MCNISLKKSKMVKLHDVYSMKEYTAFSKEFFAWKMCGFTLHA